jgi:hypothetical protein
VASEKPVLSESEASDMTSVKRVAKSYNSEARCRFSRLLRKSKDNLKDGKSGGDSARDTDISGDETTSGEDIANDQTPLIEKEVSAASGVWRFGGQACEVFTTVYRVAAAATEIVAIVQIGGLVAYTIDHHFNRYIDTKKTEIEDGNTTHYTVKPKTYHASCKGLLVDGKFVSQEDLQGVAYLMGLGPPPVRLMYHVLKGQTQKIITMPKEYYSKVNCALDEKKYRIYARNIPVTINGVSIPLGKCWDSDSVGEKYPGILISDILGSTDVGTMKARYSNFSSAMPLRALTKEAIASSVFGVVYVNYSCEDSSKVDVRSADMIQSAYHMIASHSGPSDSMVDVSDTAIEDFTMYHRFLMDEKTRFRCGIGKIPEKSLEVNLNEVLIIFFSSEIAALGCYAIQEYPAQT